MTTSRRATDLLLPRAGSLWIFFMDGYEMELIDIGANLAHRAFAHDLHGTLDRARQSGVNCIVVTGGNIASSRTAAALAGQYPGFLFSTAGVHPHDAGKCSNAEVEAMVRTLCSKKQVAAIGECGLDFNRDFSPRPQQESRFETQIELACELGKPLFLHERDAHRRFVEILASHRDNLGAAVVHCFTGTAEQLRAYLDLGLYIGITGWICDDRRGLELRNIVRNIPLDRLMIETDAPFLVPRNMPSWRRQKTNEPAFLPYVLEMISKCYGVSDRELAARTTSNARKFFKIIQ
jgi:TatD DNase family protein